MTPTPLHIPEGSRLSRPPVSGAPSWDERVSLLRDADGRVLAEVESLGPLSVRELPRD